MQMASLLESVGQLASLPLKVMPPGWCEKAASLPGIIGELASQQTLQLSFCQLAPLPESAGQLASLRALHLRGGELLGSLPESIDQLASLYTLQGQAYLAQGPGRQRDVRPATAGGGFQSPASGAYLRLRTSAVTFASPGRCSWTSGPYSDAATSRAASRAISPSAALRVAGQKVSSVVSIVTLSPLIRSSTRLPFQRWAQHLRATRAFSVSQTCWPAGSPILWPCIFTSWASRATA